MIAWPLILLVGSDILGITVIVSKYFEGTITGRIESAYIGLGLGILQIPFCFIGRYMSIEERNKTMQRLYIVHMIFSALIIIATNIDWV